MEAMSILKVIAAVIGVAILLTSFILSIVIYPIVSNNNEDSKIALECEILEDGAAMYSNLYKIICKDTPEDENCKLIQEDIKNFDTYSKAFLDTYGVERCLDIWP